MDIVHSKRPVLVFLMETKLNESRLQYIKNKIGFSGLLCVSSLGLSGGLGLMWKDNITVDILSFSKNHIDAKITSDDLSLPWRFTGYYGNPERNRRRESWALLSHLATQNNLPWAIMGDFNDLRDPSEKLGPNPHPPWLYRGFNDTITNCGLRDFNFDGSQYTWEKARGKPDWTKEKLDRILVSDSWLDVFNGATTTSFEAPSSDHLPLALWPVAVDPRYKRKSFKFENIWVKEAQCRVIIQNSWNLTKGLPLTNRLEICSHEIWKWGKKRTRNFQSEIDNCKRRMSFLRDKSNRASILNFDLAQKQCLQLLNQQSLYWKQRAKAFWLKDGDTNSKFFHESVRRRRWNNNITKLKDDNGRWIENGPAL